MGNEVMNNISSLVSSFVSDFFSNPENADNTEKWLCDKVTAMLPDADKNDKKNICSSIVETINKINSNIQSIDNAIESGGTRESWLCSAVDNSLDNLSYASKAKILMGCCTALESAAGVMNNNEQFKINGELKAFDELWNESDWNEYNVSELTMNVAQQAGAVALKTLAENVMSGIEDGVQNGIELTDEQLCAAVGSAADIGVKTAAAGALQVAYKKGLLDDLLPFDVKPQALADIAVGAIENVKTIAAVANGTLSTEEAIDRVQRNTIARVVNFLGEYGEEVGTAIGGIFGPQGAAVGCTVGKAISFLAKTEAKPFLIESANKLCTCARECFNNAFETAKGFLTDIKNAIFA